MTGWRFRDAVREGVARARHGRWVTLSIALLTAAGLSIGAAADAARIGQIVREEQAWVDAGGRMLLASDEDGLDPAACDRLVRSDAVIAAGATTVLTTRAVIDAAPDLSLRLVGYSPGVPALIGAEATAATSVLVSAAVAEELGLVDGARVTLRPAQAPTGGQLSEGLAAPLPADPLTVVIAPGFDRLGEVYEGALLVPAPVGASADTCALDTAPGAKSAIRELAASLGGARGTAATIVQDRLLESEFTADFGTLYAQRELAAAPWLFGVLLGLFGALLRWFRRADDALYALLGAGHAQRFALHLSQWLLTTVLGAALGVGIVVVWSLAVTVPDSTLVATFTMRFAAITLLCATATTLLTLLIPSGRPFAALRDR